ncbi:iron chelate uptake ABC transporter family permease subunit [Erwinia sp. CPCC 100877]|nr:iron chelate uptake ABC transporter family permease subunit [Erwinia sp. CPCC 100877]
MAKYFKMTVPLFFLFLAAWLSITSGTFEISFSDLWNLLIHQTGTEQAKLILWEFRMPRLLLAALVGGALATAGYVLQAITRNPIADSGLLGVNSGAAFGSVLYYFIVGSYFTEATQVQSVSLVFFGLLGTLLALLLNFALSVQRFGMNMQRFILNGIGISTGFSALTTYFSLKINADDYSRVNNWLEGSINQGNWQLVLQLLPWVLVTVPLIFLFREKLELMRYSDVQLQNIGFATGRWRMMFVLLAAIMICASVLIAGNVSFVGLLVPHLTAQLVRRQSKLYIPFVFMNGMSLVILCDTLVKNIFAPNELPLNAMMGLLGIPYLILAYLTNQQKKGELVN